MLLTRRGRSAGRYRFKASYSAGIQIGVIPFGRWSFSRDETRLSAPAADLSFTGAVHDAGTRFTASPPGYRSTIALEFDAAAALTGCRHDADTHRLEFGLDTALTLADDAPRTMRGFSIQPDPDLSVARGEVVSEPIEGGRRLTWRVHSPAWARDYPFESIIRTNESGYEPMSPRCGRSAASAPVVRAPPCVREDGLRAGRGCPSRVPLSSGRQRLMSSSAAAPAPG